MRLITNSEIKSLFMCPRNHELGYVKGLTPKRKKVYFDEGTAAHNALEVFYRGGTEDEAINAFDKVYDEHIAKLEPYPHDKEKAIAKFLRTRALVAVYLEKIGPKDMEIYDTSHVEEEFCVPIIDPSGNPVPDVMFAGKIDGIWKEKAGYKASMVVEHKFYSSFSETENTLYLDQQLTLYALASALAFGITVNVSLYNVCKKPGNEKTKKETPEEFFYRVYEIVSASEDSDKYFHRMPITRGPQHYRLASEILYKAAMIITGKTPLPYIHRNVSDSCLWLCPFKSICIEEDPRTVEQMFEKKVKRHQELGMKED